VQPPAIAAIIATATNRCNNGVRPQCCIARLRFAAMPDPSADATTLESWASAHGFTPSERGLQGETPLLRQGLVDVATDVHEGELDGRPARVFNLYVDGAGLPVPGDTGVTTAAFTVLLVEVDAPAWPRVTIHPAEFSEGSWLSRLLRHDDHGVHSVHPAFDASYRLRVADSTDDADVDRLRTSELIEWAIAQPSLIFDLENNVDTGDSLVVAAAGDSVDEAVLDRLAEQARWLTAWFERSA